MAYPAGRLLELWDKRSLLPVVVLEGEGARLRVLNPRGREMRCPVSRVAHDTGIDLETAAAREALAERLRTWSEEADARAAGLSLETLWGVLVEDPEERRLEELAELALDDQGPEARSALLRSLLNDPIYFERGQDGFLPRDAERVEGARARIEAEARRARREEAFEELLRGALSGSRPEPAAREGYPEELAALEGLVLEGLAHPGAKRAQALLKGLPLGETAGPEEAAFVALAALGVFAEDEDVARRRLGLREAFPDEVTTAAASAALASEERERVERPALAVDDPWTSEVDDALSLLEEGPDGWRIQVHVADPAAWIPAGGPVDREALARGVTHYFPTGRVPMLPPGLGEEAASLGGGGERPALTLEIAISAEGEIREILPRLTLLTRVERLTYDEADALLEGGPEGEEAAILSGLAAAGRARLRRRLDAGAVLLRRPELDVRVREGRIEVRRLETAAPSRLLVAEMMVLAGEAAGSWLSVRGIPAIYRRQPPLEEPLEEGAIGLEGPYDPVLVRRVRRRLRPGEVRTEPGPHHGLGLEAYVQVTSPLRRYQDLAAHRQLRSALAGDPPAHDQAELQRIAATTEDVERTARGAERDSAYFWLLRHLEGRVGEECEAVVLEAGRRTLVELHPWLTNAGLPPRGAHAPGVRIRVRIVAARARAGLLRVEEVG